jgi:hypothetical protein
VGGPTVKILYEDKKIPTDWKSFPLQFEKRERGDHTYMRGNFAKNKRESSHLSG